MAAEIVNLRLARKRKARADREQAAAESRALHGRSKADKARERQEASKAAAFVDGHRREPQDGGEA